VLILLYDIVGNDVTLIDTGVAVANHLQLILTTQALLTPAEIEPSITIWTNNNAENKESVIQKLWDKENIKINNMTLLSKQVS